MKGKHVTNVIIDRDEYHKQLELRGVSDEARQGHVILY
jgi:hypothetical protein